MNFIFYPLCARSGPSIFPGPSASGCHAFTANCVQIHPVPLRRESVALHQFLLQLFYLLVNHFDKGTALGAYHVVVVFVPEEVLVAGSAVVKMQFAAQTALAEKPQGSIHRGKADGGMFFFDCGPQFEHREVFFDIQECFQYPIALFAVFEAFTRAVFLEQLFFAQKTVVFGIDIHFQDPLISIYFLKMNVNSSVGKGALKIRR
jgi:hypothetical protein